MKKITLLLAAVIGLAACLPPLPKALTLGDIRLPLVGQEEMWAAADYEGKPVLIVFMGSWCPWCKRTMPAINAIAAEYGDQVEIVGAFMDGSSEPVEEVLKEHELKVKALFDTGEFAEELGVGGVPHSILFDKKHRAVKMWEGYSPNFKEEFDQQIKLLL
ncbi:MAG: TlpA family protein disulfide reductase [Elusimicrobiaceae bacterium]|nr:TlpA family protein disulfide reductase [Elusimicrobiaceae bacterium]